MRWLFPEPPLWVWSGDTWDRVGDGKKFKADIHKGSWIAEDGEVVQFPKECKIDEV